MGRVYTDWSTVPDDPMRVGDEDYEPYNSFVRERDPDAEYDRFVYEEMMREQKDNNKTIG